MKKIRYIILSLLLFINLQILAQINLAPNSSFETIIGSYSNCQKQGIEDTPPWESPTGGSPDFFNTCISQSLNLEHSVPQNYIGYQYPRTGNGYGGFCTFHKNVNNFREYIQTKLTNTLYKNKKYNVKFYVSLGDSICYAIYDIGIFFSDTAIGHPFNHSPLFVIPQISNLQGNFITDKKKWTEISGTYTANGGEKYITIGCFNKDDAHLDTLFVEGEMSSTNPYISYYYIDDVSVTLYEDTAETEQTDIFIPTAFTPNNDGQNDILYVRGGLKNMEIKIFNQWGLKVFETNEQSRGWNGIYKGEKQPTGNYVYMFKATTTQDKEIIKNGVLSLIR